MGGTIPRQVVLGCIKEQASVSHAQQASKQYPSMVSAASVPASRFPLEFLPGLLSGMEYDPKVES